MGRVIATWRYNLKFSIQSHLFLSMQSSMKNAQEQAQFDMSLKMVRNSIRSIMGVGLSPQQEAKSRVIEWRRKVWRQKGFLTCLRKLGFYDDGVERYRMIQAIVALRIGRSREMHLARDSGMKLKNQLARLSGESFAEKAKQATMVSNLRNELLSYRHGESSYIKKLQQQIYTLQEEQKVLLSALRGLEIKIQAGEIEAVVPLDSFYQPQGGLDPALGRVLNGIQAAQHKDAMPLTAPCHHSHPSDHPLQLHRLASPGTLDVLEKQRSGDEWNQADRDKYWALLGCDGLSTFSEDLLARVARWDGEEARRSQAAQDYRITRLTHRGEKQTEREAWNQRSPGQVGSPERREVNGSPEHVPRHDPAASMTAQERDHLSAFHSIHRSLRQGTPSEMQTRSQQRSPSPDAPSQTRNGITPGLGFTPTDLRESDRLASTAYHRLR